MPIFPFLRRRAGVLLAFALTALTGCIDEDKVAGPTQLRPQAAVGEVFTVTNVNDSGAGSLRQAIADAGAGGTIQFDPSLSGQTDPGTNTAQDQRGDHHH